MHSNIIALPYSAITKSRLLTSKLLSGCGNEIAVNNQLLHVFSEKTIMQIISYPYSYVRAFEQIKGLYAPRDLFVCINN